MQNHSCPAKIITFTLRIILIMFKNYFVRYPYLILAALVILLLFSFPNIPCSEAAVPVLEDSDLLACYDPGVPPSVAVEWAFPSKFSLGFSAEYFLRSNGETALPNHSTSKKMNLFPLSFLMKYSLYQGKRISQSVGLGLGPYFLHQGPMPVQLDDLKMTGNSTYFMEWITQITKNLYMNLNMKYTHSFQDIINEIPLRSFSTWLGLNLHW